jgi:hypothetical protein
MWMAAAATLVGQPAHAVERTYLLSLKAMPVRANEYLDQFTLETWGVDFLAVCHIPAGWDITAGRYGDPGGHLKGVGNIGVAYLDPSHLSNLKAIALVRLDAVQRRAIRYPNHAGGVPATFGGSGEIGRYGNAEHYRHVRLTYRNVRLAPATQCPRLPASGGL